jgi:hypothetical protein
MYIHTYTYIYIQTDRQTDRHTWQQREEAIDLLATH